MVRKEVIGNAMLYLGNCLEVLPLIPAVQIAVVTDPPYGDSHASMRGATWAGKQIAGDDSTEGRDAVREWVHDRPWAFCGTWKVRAPRGTRGTLAWDKGDAGSGDLSFPWKPSWELVFVGGIGWKGHRGPGLLRGKQVITWESKGRLHPHEKPVWLFEQLLEKLPQEYTVIDPFMGSGTCGVACHRLGRSYIGVEVDAHHFGNALERIENAKRQEGMFA